MRSLDTIPTWTFSGIKLRAIPDSWLSTRQAKMLISCHPMQRWSHKWAFFRRYDHSSRSFFCTIFISLKGETHCDQWRTYSCHVADQPLFRYTNLQLPARKTLHSLNQKSSSSYQIWSHTWKLFLFRKSWKNKILCWKFYKTHHGMHIQGGPTNVYF